MSVATGSRDARVHTQPSNRASAALAKGKSKASDERRVAYKPVLVNPYQVKWPSTPLNVQNSVLACLADLLPEAFRAKRQARAKATQHPQRASAPASRKRARGDDNTSDSKRTKLAHDPTPEETSGAAPSSVPLKKNATDIDELGKPSSSSQFSKNTTPSQCEETSHEPLSTIEPAPRTTSARSAVPMPPILKHCVFGINEVTKRLEILANPALTHEARAAHGPRLRAVLVCRPDVDPPLLIAHLPILVATCNSSLPIDSSDDRFIRLVELPMGAEHSLAELTGLRRVAVMALDVETPVIERLELLLSSVPVLRETWLALPSSSVQEPKELIPTHVKQLKTSAPKDMKAAKEKRKRELGEAKERGNGGRDEKRRRIDTKGMSDAV